jgi:hypothetical protein
MDRPDAVRRGDGILLVGRSRLFYFIMPRRATMAAEAANSTYSTYSTRKIDPSKMAYLSQKKFFLRQ